MTYVPSLTSGTLSAASAAAKRTGENVTLSSIDTQRTVIILPSGRIVER